MSRLRGVCIGAGYFSAFQYEAWSRIPEVDIVAVSDLNPERSEAVQKQYGISQSYIDYIEMFDEIKPDFVDVITTPVTHREICREAGKRGIHIICQKPLAPTFEESQTIVDEATAAGIRFMVHENFRFQPWHRKLKELLNQGAIGSKLHTLNFRTRTGDGWGEEAYLARQPYFRDMPRFLVHETAIHLVDVFRFLLGEVDTLLQN